MAGSASGTSVINQLLLNNGGKFSRKDAKLAKKGRIVFNYKNRVREISLAPFAALRETPCGSGMSG
jgi:hypothetical protein